MKEYIRKQTLLKSPVLPFEGNIDLTYRCNNDCRHCWVREPLDSKQVKNELTLNEIEHIAKEAKMLGCKNWVISGGEPMVRDDFKDIFILLSGMSVSYTLNTNGTLITPGIASMMKRNGANLVSIYGADAEVHDHITGNRGSFDAALRGMTYLNEAGAPFIVQIVPMRSNFFQYKNMIELALKFSNKWRVGAPWLYLSANRDLTKNRLILEERLDASQLLEIEKPVVDNNENDSGGTAPLTCNSRVEDSYLLQCSVNMKSFHIDPNGLITFCEFIKDPALKFDLRKGSFAEYWDEFRPGISKMIRADEEYGENCGNCDLSGYCSWCPPVGYLEHGRYNAKVDYLCENAKMKKEYIKKFRKKNRKFFHLGGMTIKVDSDKEFGERTFITELDKFEIQTPVESESVIIDHKFDIPPVTDIIKGKLIHDHPPWKVYDNGDYWAYLGFSPENDLSPTKVVITDRDHSRVNAYHDTEIDFSSGNFNSITLMSSDQIILSRTLAVKNAFYIHSSGLKIDENGFLFVGHSEAGKSTICKLFRDNAKILCDDRNIIRKWEDGFRLHGTWSHGELPDVSPDSAPLKGIFFLNKSDQVEIKKIIDRKKIVKELLKCVIRPVADTGWWNKILDLLENIAEDVPCYDLYFDKSEKVVEVIKAL